MFAFDGALHVYVDKHSKDGVVYVMGYTHESAVKATKKLHGTYFDGTFLIILIYSKVKNN